MYQTQHLYYGEIVIRNQTFTDMVSGFIAAGASLFAVVSCAVYVCIGMLYVVPTAAFALNYTMCLL